MKAPSFQTARFLASCFKEGDFPKPSFPEIAIAGRSNVGKSSLINHLLGKKTLAKTSSTPGKTQSVNFFMIDEALFLVDLPGYGFAKASRTAQNQWGLAIEQYLESRLSIQLFLLLMDARHPPRETDFSFIHWAASKKIPLLFIFTKTDKLKKNELSENITESLKAVTPLLPAEYPYSWIPFSNKDLFSRKVLIHNIQQALVNGTA